MHPLADSEFELMGIYHMHMGYGESHGLALGFDLDLYRRIADDAWTCRLEFNSTRTNTSTLQCPPRRAKLDSLERFQHHYHSPRRPTGNSTLSTNTAVRYLPTWLPFMGLKRHALATAELVGEVMEMPLREIKEKRVRVFFFFSALLLHTISSWILTN